MKKYTSHRLCNMVPGMSAEAFAMLKADIQKNGLIEPIWIFNGKILDGRNRYKACLELDIEPGVRQYEGQDPAGFVVSQNIVRRHLTRQQKAGLIKRLLKLNPEKSNRAIAQIAGSSHTTVSVIRNSTGQIGQTTQHVRRDGRTYTYPKSPPVVHRAASLVSRVDFECRKLLKFISDLNPDEITDAQDFIAQLESQLARLKNDLPEVKAG